jgi:DNA-binding NtrC family response regulator
VLVVTPHSEDHKSLANIFAHTNWTLLSARNYGETRAILCETPVPVIISEYQFDGRTWRDISRLVRDLQTQTRLLVTSRRLDDRIWAEVLNEGGYDCLMKPFQKEEVLSMISLAWQSWKDSSNRMHVASQHARASAMPMAG